MSFEKLELGIFLNDLASDSPAPGGGSAAALGGAIGAALTSMVANLTVGKEKYKDNWPVVEKVLAKIGPIREELTKLMDEDTAAFNAFMDAVRMKKDTEDQKAARKKAMAEATIKTTEVPLLTLEKCVEMAELALDALKYGNPNAASDAGSAIFFAFAAVKAASYNVRINLPGIKDEEFAKECKRRMDEGVNKIELIVRGTEARMNTLLG